MVKRKERSLNSKSITILNNEQMVKRYFDLIGQKDLEGLVDLFSDDAVVHEPFSNESKGLQGKASIENFLRVALIANSGMNRTIHFTDKRQESITALVTFERGDTITGKFTFHFVTEDWGRKIKFLRISFVS